MSENKAYIHPKTGNLVTPKGLTLWFDLHQRGKAKNGKEGKFQYNIAIPKAADITAMKEAALEAGKEKFGKLFSAAGGKWPSGVKSPFKKSADNDKLVNGLEGAGLKVEDFPIMVGARSKDAPGVVGPDGKPVVDETSVYHGRWSRATLQAFAYDTDGNKGVTFGLVNVQLLDEGEELVIGGGRVSAESEFEAVEGVSGDDNKSSDDLFG